MKETTDYMDAISMANRGRYHETDADLEAQIGVMEEEIDDLQRRVDRMYIDSAIWCSVSAIAGFVAAALFMAVAANL